MSTLFPMIAFLASLALAVAAVQAAPSADEITSLPGWNKSLPSKMYSGYVDGMPGQHIHYVFVQSTEADPSKAPVVVWSNGGPGASSLIGWLTELGIFALNDASLGPNGTANPPELFLNPYAWARAANMLYFEHPAPVGASYCDNADACENNDTSAGVNLAMSISSFFKGFPEFAGRDFYIVGESYAGIYIPMAVKAIEEQGDKNINLKGFAIGDGCIGLVGGCGSGADKIYFETFGGLRMMSPTTFEEAMSVCDWEDSPRSKECDELVAQGEKEVGDPYVYYVYSTCGGGDNAYVSALDRPVSGSFHEQMEVDEEGGFRMHRMFRRNHNVSQDSDNVWTPIATHPRTKADVAALQAAKPQFAAQAAVQAAGSNVETPVTYACGSSRAMEAWMDDDAVKKALHLKTDAPSFPFKYKRTENDVRPYFAEWTKKYNIVIYSGQADACVPTPGTFSWVSGLGYDVATEWHPWTTQMMTAMGQKDILSGYAIEYSSSEQQKIALAVFTNSGHMVPQYAGAAAYNFFTSFLDGKSL